jgi:hypothetical protein
MPRSVGPKKAAPAYNSRGVFCQTIRPGVCQVHNSRGQQVPAAAVTAQHRKPKAPPKAVSTCAAATNIQAYAAVPQSPDANMLSLPHATHRPFALLPHHSALLMHSSQHQKPAVPKTLMASPAVIASQFRHFLCHQNAPCAESHTRIRQQPLSRHNHTLCLTTAQASPHQKPARLPAIANM